MTTNQVVRNWDKIDLLKTLKNTRPKTQKKLIEREEQELNKIDHITQLSRPKMLQFQEPVKISLH
jgi:hypothetical protein